jgi:hypothetical protein
MHHHEHARRNALRFRCSAQKGLCRRVVFEMRVEKGKRIARYPRIAFAALLRRRWPMGLVVAEAQAVAGEVIMLHVTQPDGGDIGMLDAIDETARLIFFVRGERILLLSKKKATAPGYDQV